MVAEETIERAGRLLADAARKPARIILFGSHARGDADPESDFDFLVVEPNAGNRFDEMVRLRRVLDPLRVPADVVVISAQQVVEWSEVDGTMIHAALSEGRLIAEA